MNISVLQGRLLAAIRALVWGSGLRLGWSFGDLGSRARGRGFRIWSTAALQVLLQNSKKKLMRPLTLTPYG